MNEHLIYINNRADMNQAITQIFSKIPPEQLNTAIHCGLLLGTAASIFYLFFGRLLSMPELLGICLKKPTSQQSRNSLVVIAGFVFLSAILRTFYHEHISAYYPFDDQVYLQKISTLRLIISGALVGIGSQMALNGRENSGIMGVPNFSLSSFAAFITLFGSAMLTVTYRIADKLPKTPRIIQNANQALPRNISYDAYFLVTFLTPFAVFLISKKKTLKGLIESIAHFIIGILLAAFLMLMNWGSIKSFYKKFTYSKGWTGQMFVAFAIAMLMVSIIYLIVRYGFKKPLFSNSLIDKKTPMTFKSFIGYILAGIGLGLGGMLFDSFLLTVPSSQIRIAVFWGVPCIFCIKAVQVLSQRSQLPAVEEKKA